MLSFEITGIYQNHMIFHLISHWINWIAKSLKLKLFLLVYFLLTVKFLKNINIFFKNFFQLFAYILFFFSLFNN